MRETYRQSEREKREILHTYIHFNRTYVGSSKIMNEVSD